MKDFCDKKSFIDSIIPVVVVAEFLKLFEQWHEIEESLSKLLKKKRKKFKGLRKKVIKVGVENEEEIFSL